MDTNDRPILKLSVNHLVDFCWRRGDLFAIADAGVSMRDGQRIHRMLQNTAKNAAQTEYSLCHRLNHRACDIEIRGRIDILHATASPPRIEEIKTVNVAPSRLPSNITDRHWAQGKLYAMLYCLEEASAEKEIDVTMHWYELGKNRSHEKTQRLRIDNLQAFFYQSLDIYLDWYLSLQELRQQTIDSAHTLAFPYEIFRPQQRQFARQVFRCVRQQQRYLCEAPTGTGKTISTLFPGIKAIGESLIDKIIYLTAKTSGRQIALKTLADLQDDGLKISILEITAKAQICFCRHSQVARPDTDPCPFTVGFFDRLPDARKALLSTRTMNREAIVACADEHHLCPFELSLQMLPWASVVICDYNYVFDPLVALSWLQETNDRMTLLVDEAHNLPDRARSMFSAKISAFECRQQQKHCPAELTVITRILPDLCEAVDQWLEEQPAGESSINGLPEELTHRVTDLLAACQQEWQRGQNLPHAMGDWIREMLRYGCIAQLADEHHRLLSRSGHRNQAGQHMGDLRLRCLDATNRLITAYERFHSIVFFSATLRPLDYYSDALGLDKQSSTDLLDSPFPVTNMALLVCPYVRTHYQNRTASVQDIVALIATVWQQQAGNYIVFFPAYAYMQEVHQAFTASRPDIDVQIQHAESDEQTRKAFLDRFQPGYRTLGFAITGGVFGEGVDYIGERLIGAIIVGVGLPWRDLERELMRENFHQTGRDGFAYAYQYPGFTRVQQTAGRVIRSEHDRGIVVLVDERFASRRYQRLFPAHWQGHICANPEKMQRTLADFWQNITPG